MTSRATNAPRPLQLPPRSPHLVSFTCAAHQLSPRGCQRPPNGSASADRAPSPNTSGQQLIGQVPPGPVQHRRPAGDKELPMERRGTGRETQGGLLPAAITWGSLVSAFGGHQANVCHLGSISCAGLGELKSDVGAIWPTPSREGCCSAGASRQQGPGTQWELFCRPGRRPCTWRAGGPFLPVWLAVPEPARLVSLLPGLDWQCAVMKSTSRSPMLFKCRRAQPMPPRREREMGRAGGRRGDAKLSGRAADGRGREQHRLRSEQKAGRKL